MSAVADGVAESGVELTIDGEDVSLDWYFWSSQMEALGSLEQDDHDLTVYQGGYGSGKSILGSRWIDKIALATPNGRTLVMGRDFSKSKNTTYKVFFEELPGENTVDKGGEKGDPENSPFIEEYNRNEKRLTWFNGHVTILGSGDEWSREAGAEYNGIWCDEVAHYERVDLYKLIEMLVSRQRTKGGPNVMLWTSTGNGFGQFYDIVYRRVDADENEIPTRIDRVVADTRNNPFHPNLEKQLNQFEGTAREEEALAGGFAAADDLVYDTFRKEYSLISRQEARNRVTEWRAYGYDHGWNHPRVVIEMAMTPYDQYVVKDMFFEENTEIEDAIEWLEDKRRGRMYCEHEPAHAEKFRKNGFRTIKANKKIDIGIPMVRERFMRDKHGKPGILISRACDDMVQELLSYKKEHVGRVKAPDHSLDALRYVIATDASRPDLGSGEPLPSYSAGVR